MICKICKNTCENWRADCRDNCDLCTCSNNHIQPERSKREDLDFKKLSDEFYNNYVTKENLENYDEENGAIKVLDMFADFLNQRCGALNIVETQ